MPVHVPQRLEQRLEKRVNPRGVLRPQTPPRKIWHAWFAPSAGLEPFIAHYWTVRWDLRGEPSFPVTTLPHPCVHLLFERGQALVGGLSTTRFQRRLRGHDRVFGIKFRPGAFQPYFGAPLSRITNRMPSLRSVFGPPSDALKDAILAEPDLRRCVALAETFLLERRPRMPRDIANIRDLVEQLAADCTITRVDQAAARLGVSVRKLQRLFDHAIGVGPKWVIKRYRLHEAIAQLAAPTPPDMASLALTLGYCDQAHFIEDFKSMVGRPPGAYISREPRRQPARRAGREP
jgi:AraC-like DNA-binding protein